MYIHIHRYSILEGSKGVVSDNWFDGVFLSIRYMFKPSC